MHPYFQLTCGKCLVASASPVGNASFSLLPKWEMHHSLYLTSTKYIIVCTSTVGNTSLFYHYSGNSIIVPSSPVENVSLSLLHLWEIHHYLFLICRKYFTASTSSSENASLSLNCGKRNIVSTSPVG